MAVTISIYHAPGRCVKCERMEEIAGSVADSFPGRVEIALTPIDEAPPELGVIMPPTMTVDGRLVAVGRLPNKQDVAGTVAELLSEDEPEATSAGEGSAFAHGQMVIDDGRIFICAGDFEEEPGCEPMLLFWYVDEGDAVTEGQELAEVESAKAVYVIESPIDATVESILVGAGGTIQPAQRLAELSAADHP
jgi:biotin carboxyl carrier protein